VWRTRTYLNETDGSCCLSMTGSVIIKRIPHLQKRARSPLTCSSITVKKRILFLLILGISCRSLLADLQVFPTRIVLTDQKKVANLSLRHHGSKPGQYKVSAVFYRMKPDGNLELVTDATEAERPLIKLLHFSPRVVTIPPNREQIVRVMLSPPGNLPEAEYRAHLHFEPTDDNEQGIEAVPTKKEPIAMQLMVKVAIAIPVIFRHGKTSASVALTHLTLSKTESNQTVYSVDLEATGNAFPFGDIHATFTPAGKEPVQVGLVKSLSSYRDKRTISYPLNAPTSVPLNHGTLKLEFKEPEDQGGKTIAFAEKTLP